jgi:hypothetical protein
MAKIINMAMLTPTLVPLGPPRVRHSSLGVRPCCLISRPFHFCITASNSLLLRPAIHIIASESKEVAHVGMRKRGLIGRPICPLHNAGSSRLVVIREKLPILGQLLGSHPFLDWRRRRVSRHRKREKQCNKLMLGSFANSCHLLFDVAAHFTSLINHQPIFSIYEHASARHARTRSPFD